MKTKTIDIQAKEWNDRINGTTYFSGEITVNYGLEDQEIFIMPFQYGYSDQYMQQARSILAEFHKIDIGLIPSLTRYCRENDIQLNASIKKNCLKRELKEIVDTYNARVEATKCKAKA